MNKLQYERPVITRLNTGVTNKFGTKTEYAPVTHIDGNAVKDLISNHGSPLFVISEKTIRENKDKLSSFTRNIYDKLRHIVPVFVDDTPKYEEINSIMDYLKNNNPKII